jgi:hypothetical protein
MQAGVALRFSDDGLVVHGASASSSLAVFPSELVGHADGLQPAAGRFEEHGDDLLFVPRFPLVAGLSYSLLIDGIEAAAVDVAVQASTPTTEVVSIHPASGAAPLNLLRIHVSFSAPMSDGFAARAIQVRGAETGERLEDAFLQGPELWDMSRQRLTLLRAPGYLLTDGDPVWIRVDRSMPDAAGRPLRGGAGRVYRIGPALREPIDLKAWRLVTPAAGTTEPLVVDFDRPLDRVLLADCLEVLADATTLVAGDAAIDEGERVWRFEPAFPWQPGTYVLRVDARLEDLAGNRATDAPHVDVPFAIPYTNDPEEVSTQ